MEQAVHEQALVKVGGEQLAVERAVTVKDGNALFGRQVGIGSFIGDGGHKVHNGRHGG